MRSERTTAITFAGRENSLTLAALRSGEARPRPNPKKYAVYLWREKSGVVSKCTYSSLTQCSLAKWTDQWGSMPMKDIPAKQARTDANKQTVIIT